MGKDINDGYTRHVGIGDDEGSQKVEFKFRRPQGSALFNLETRLVKADMELDNWRSLTSKQRKQRKKPKSSTQLLNSLMAGCVVWIKAESFEGQPELLEVEPDAAAFEKLDAHAYTALVNLVINGQAPDEIYDRPEQDDQPLASVEQSGADAKNS